MKNLKSKIGQLLIVGFPGEKLTSEYRDFLEKNNIGGVILFKENCQSLDQLEKLVNTLKEIQTENPLLLTVDHEGGRVHRLPKPFTRFPQASLIGEAWARNSKREWGAEVGRAMARELSAAGFHLDFAPVLDVWSNPTNKVIADRAFGNHPNLVSELGNQMIRGLQENGVAACGKHFPGHGDTNEDSHFDLPILSHNVRRIKEFELIPFQNSLDVGVASLMTGHVIYEGFDPHMPATLSVKILRDLLRREIGFQGVLFSDDLVMNAVSKRMPTKEVAFHALRAGCDSLIISKNIVEQQECLDRLCEAVQSGELPEERVNEACQRLEGLKKAYVLRGDFSPLKTWIGCQEHLELQKEILSITT